MSPSTAAHHDPVASAGRCTVKVSTATPSSRLNAFASSTDPPCSASTPATFANSPGLSSAMTSSSSTGTSYRDAAPPGVTRVRTSAGRRGLAATPA